MFDVLAVAAAVTVAWLPPSVCAVLVLRQSLRRLDRAQRDCDEWRQAAANATVAARVAAANPVPELDDDDDDGEEWKTAG